MINNILNTFRKQAREHKAIRSFYYNRNYEIGSGNEKHPLLWLEDPIMGRNLDHVFTSTVNFSILFIPDDETEVNCLQNIAFSVGLNILERIKADVESEVAIQPNWSYLTLRNYYDNNACGCRFSLELTHRNMQNLCLIEEQFDVDKQFADSQVLHADSAVRSVTRSVDICSNVLPVFDLKIAKQ